MQYLGYLSDILNNTHGIIEIVAVLGWPCSERYSRRLMPSATA